MSNIVVDGGQASPILSRKMTTEDAIRLVLKLWQDTRPEEVAAFHNDMYKFRSALSNNGWSHGGSMLLVGTVPRRVEAMLGKFIPGFWEDEKKVRLFYKVFKPGAMNDPGVSKVIQSRS